MALLMTGHPSMFGLALVVLSLGGYLLLTDRPILRALAASALLWVGIVTLPELFYHYVCTWFCW